MATQINNRNNGNTFKKKASTLFSVGQFVEIDGTTGFIQPATNTTPVLGISNQQITAASADYALNTDLNITEGTYNTEFEIPVSTGPAVATLVGQYLAIDAAGTGVVVAGASATVSAATPILVTRFIDASTIEGKIAFRF